MRNNSSQANQGEHVKRRLFRLLAVLLMVLCAILWADSYSQDTFIQYGWTPSRHPDRLIGIAFAWGRGQIVFAFASEPLAFEESMDAPRNLPHFARPGFRRWISTPRPAASWKEYLDLRPGFDRIYDSIAANADGSIIMNAHGAIYTNAPRQLPFDEYFIHVPLWLLILLLGAEPAWWLFDLPARRRRKRLAAGQCVTCGYDLTATPERCPECGTVSLKAS
jgi:hypothetical protein